VKTDDLIRALAADCATRPMSLRRPFTMAMIPGVAIAFAFISRFSDRGRIFWGCSRNRDFCLRCAFLFCSLHLPHDWSCVLASRALKFAAPPPACDRSRPAGAGILAELLSVPAGLWSQKLIGTNALVCLKSIPFLGLAPLAAILFCLRQGAPEHPALAGAAAGLLAGAIGAALYATHCRTIRRFLSRSGIRWRLPSSPPLALF